MTDDEIKTAMGELEAKQAIINTEIFGLQKKCRHPNITGQFPHEVCDICKKVFQRYLGGSVMEQSPPSRMLIATH